MSPGSMTMTRNSCIMVKHATSYNGMSASASAGTGLSLVRFPFADFLVKYVPDNLHISKLFILSLRYTYPL